MKAIISGRSKLGIQEEKHLNFILNKKKVLGKLLSPFMKKVVLLKVNIWKKPGIKN